MDVRFCSEQEPTAERQRAQRQTLIELATRSPERERKTRVFHLTKTYMDAGYPTGTVEFAAQTLSSRLGDSASTENRSWPLGLNRVGLFLWTQMGSGSRFKTKTGKPGSPDLPAQITACDVDRRSSQCRSSSESSSCGSLVHTRVRNMPPATIVDGVSVASATEVAISFPCLTFALVMTKSSSCVVCVVPTVRTRVITPVPSQFTV